MTSITYDATCNLKTEITCGWCTCNVGCAPTVLEVWEEKSVGIGNVKQEYIFITPIREPIEPFQLHGDTYWHEVIMKLDIRTYSTIARHKAVVAEVARIVKNIVRNTDDGFLDVIIMGIDPKTPDVRNIFRDVLTLRYRSAESHTFV